MTNPKSEPSKEKAETCLIEPQVLRAQNKAHQDLVQEHQVPPGDTMTAGICWSHRSQPPCFMARGAVPVLLCHGAETPDCNTRRTSSA